ncbi:MAG: GNAT family N-acetyltransferase [Thermoguttaceae bacterium]
MEKRHIPSLQTRRARLRLLEERDLPQTLAWRNQDHIRRWFFFSERLTPEQHADWFGRYRQRGDDFVFIIEETGGELRPIGQVALYNVDWSGGTAEFGRLMIGVADATSRGLAREATDALVTLALEQLALKEVYLEVVPSNVQAIRVYEACGFELAASTEKALRMSKRAIPKADPNRAICNARKGFRE